MRHPRLAAATAALIYAVVTGLGLVAGLAAASLLWGEGPQLHPLLLVIPALVLVVELRPLHRAALDATRRHAAWQHGDREQTASAARDGLRRRA